MLLKRLARPAQRALHRFLLARGVKAQLEVLRALGIEQGEVVCFLVAQRGFVARGEGPQAVEDAGERGLVSAEQRVRRLGLGGEGLDVGFGGAELGAEGGCFGGVVRFWVGEGLLVRRL
jgi:hypothetical protein